MNITGIWLRRPVGLIVELDSTTLGLLCDDGVIRLIGHPVLRFHLDRRDLVCIKGRWYNRPLPERRRPLTIRGRTTILALDPSHVSQNTGAHP